MAQQHSAAPTRHDRSPTSPRPLRPLALRRREAPAGAKIGGAEREFGSKRTLNRRAAVAHAAAFDEHARLVAMARHVVAARAPALGDLGDAAPRLRPGPPRARPRPGPPRHPS